MATKTFEVDHPGTHYPTDAQQRAALRDALKSDGLKLSGEVTFLVVENTSGGPSKVRATFETEEAAKPAAAKTDKTMTVGGTSSK